MTISLLKDTNNQNLLAGNIPIHAALVPTWSGAAIVFFGTENQARILELDKLDQAPPQLGTKPGWWAFCAGHAFLADGRWVIAGGVVNQNVDHHGHGHHDSGERRCEIYAPLAGEFSPIQDLNFQPGAQYGGGRWYPTVVTLANGEVFCATGHPFAGKKVPDPNNPGQTIDDTTGADDYIFASGEGPRHNNCTPERYSPSRDEWTLMVNESTSHDNEELDEYARFHLAPSGHVFFSTIAKEDLRFYNPYSGAYDGTEVTGSLGEYHAGSETTSVVLPILPQDLKQVWVLACGAASTQKVNITAGDPAWETAGTPPLGKARDHACAVLLPTGSVFLSGGEVEGGPELPAAELYHPSIDWNQLKYTAGTGQWEQIDTPNIKRGYHSVSLLMPDGRVWIAGSTWSDWKQDGREMEVYTPSYIVPGRVEIVDANSSVAYAGVIDVQLSDSRTITRAVLIRCGSVTHAFDSDQRYVACQFQQNGTHVQVRAPEGPGIAPPGNYMLFLLDDQMIDGHGRPCVEAPIIRVCDQFCTPVPNMSTYSKLTVDAVKDADGVAVIDNAIWLFLENFRPHEADYPNAPSVQLNWDSPGGPPVSANLFELVWKNPWSENNDLPPDEAQRFALRYDVRVHEDVYDQVNADRYLFVTWNFEGHSCQTPLKLTTKPNPYMVDVVGGNPHWLSKDLRVFSVREGASAPMGALDLADGESPHDYLQKALAMYNDPANASDNPFDLLDTGQDDSAMDLRREVGNDRIYNFAIAKVRYVGQGQSAENVRVLFRMFNTVGTALEFDSQGNYRRTEDGPGASALLGHDGFKLVSIPFFERPRVTPDQSMWDQPPDEARTLSAQGATESTRYFGAWLDINQDFDEHIPPIFIGDGPYESHPWTSPIDPKSIKALVRNYHQCIVAEVHTTDDPIPDAADPQESIPGTPANSDNLSQRNLVWEPIGNPGSVASRTAQTTFVARPTGEQASEAFMPPRIVARDQVLRLPYSSSLSSVRIERPMPDELIFDGTHVPDGSRVTVYWPDVDIDEVLMLTDRRSSPVKVERIDDHTVRFELNGVAYLPLVGGRTAFIPGLLSVELPDGVRAGSNYHLVVHQFSGKKRRVIGSFQMQIPVEHEPDLLQPESVKLSILRWVFEQMPQEDAWRDVFVRYLKGIADRVRAFGGDPSKIEPSPNGDGKPADPGGKGGEETETIELEGKVVRVCYDCFGDFEGFVLASCKKQYTFASREKGLEPLIVRACEQRLRLWIEACDSDPMRVLRIKVICG